MLKKVIGIILSLCLIFGICAMAENTDAVSGETIPEVSNQMPQETIERPGGDRMGMGMPPMRDGQSRGTPPSMPNGEMPSRDFTPPQNSGEFTPVQRKGTGDNTGELPKQNDNAVTDENSEETNQAPDKNSPFGGRMPEGMGGFPGDMQDSSQNAPTVQQTGFIGFVKTYSTPITSVVLLIFAFIFVIFYRRKNY